MKLLRSNRPVETIFNLLGTKEDDMTFALGHVVSRSPHFASLLLAKVTGGAAALSDAAMVRLQDVNDDGRTDVEVVDGVALHVVFEAKRGPVLPGLPQLRKYAKAMEKAGAETQRLVAVTNTPNEHARLVLPADIDGVSLLHLMWRDVLALVNAARAEETNRNKHLLDEFGLYLRGILGMETKRSNMVYVVSLSNGGAWDLSFRDVVNKDRRYFYPTKGWGGPQPPNYIAFRYDGQLQSIHHVEGYDVFTNPRQHFKRAANADIKPHYLLRLGPPIVPPKRVPSGPKVVQNNRVWCMLDTLLTSATITDALAETKRRLGPAADAAEADSGDE